MTDTNELLGLIDLLEDLLDRSDLAEIEVQAGELAILLRRPGQLLAGAVSADAQPATGALHESDSHAAEPGRRGEGRAGDDREGHDGGATGRPGAGRGSGGPGGAGPASDVEDVIRGHAVIAPLTGVFYGAPSPGAAPYVTVGGEVVAGQVIGLIEAMKLFNEIKSDAAGRVVRIHAADGALVRAKQPLIEIQPS
jgi:biotin carboxyl carrier protein